MTRREALILLELAYPATRVGIFEEYMTKGTKDQREGARILRRLDEERANRPPEWWERWERFWTIYAQIDDWDD